MKKIILLITLVFSINIISAQSTFNKPLADLLDTIYNEDQGGRHQLNELQKQYGWQSEQVQSLMKKIMRQDSVNLVRVKKIIDTYGWPGPEEVGRQGTQTVFLVIQHSDSLTQVTYFPVMQDAVTKGKAEAAELALLEDRILMKQGKEQIYGSQLQIGKNGKYEFYPIQDEPNVNKRRASVGLEPIEDYAKRFDLIYTLSQQKEQ
ncbi:MAG: hypothetical protein HOP10_07940 [Chitinophagaceae bacterium]|nr:hypothetical protein [Chitinophagaceae bacterium]